MGNVHSLKSKNSSKNNKYKRRATFDSTAAHNKKTKIIHTRHTSDTNIKFTQKTIHTKQTTLDNNKNKQQKQRQSWSPGMQCTSPPQIKSSITRNIIAINVLSPMPPSNTVGRGAHGRSSSTSNYKLRKRPRKLQLPANAIDVNHQQPQHQRMQIETKGSSSSHHRNNSSTLLMLSPSKHQIQLNKNFLCSPPTQKSAAMSSVSSLGAQIFSPSTGYGKSHVASTASPIHYGGKHQQKQQPEHEHKKESIVDACVSRIRRHSHTGGSGACTESSKNATADKHHHSSKHSTKHNEIVVASRFKLSKKIGKGSFGVAYEAVDLITNQILALKLERRRNDRKSNSAMNMREIQILEKLEYCRRVPKLIWHGIYKQYHVMALELQGSNLCTLYEMGNRSFTMNTAVYIFIECLHCMEELHGKGIVHRDIKPQNFIVGRNEKNAHKVYVIDFGLSSWFINSVGEHIAYNDQCSPVGTARYASLGNHRGIHQTRRDDLESIAYMIIFFLKNQLPWQGIRANDRVKKWRKIEQKKAAINSQQLTKDLPHEFFYYLEYVKKLKYDEKPDYERLRRVFRKYLDAHGFDWGNGHPKVDWIKDESDIQSSDITVGSGDL